MRRHAEASASEPNAKSFLRHFGKHIQRHHMQCEPYTAERLCKHFKSMHRQQATGLDGLTVMDMRDMPWPLLQMLVQLLNWTKLQGIWPTRLVEGYIPLIPKGEGSAPLQLRPLSILPVIYGA